MTKLNESQGNSLTNDESRYLNTTHKVNINGSELSTILYCLEGYIQGSDDYNYDDSFKRDIERIFVELESVTDNYYAQLETQNENNYAECVDHLVSTMKSNSPVQDVTNSKKDWNDFWYNSIDDLQGENDKVFD